MKVLIVDDDVDMAELLKAVCESDGHEATACSSSRAATEELANRPVDLLITDIAMAPPDGLELVRTARAMQPDLVAIAVTGYWGRYTLPEVLATGALDLMFKPFRVEELRARLAMASERRRVALEEKDRVRRRAFSMARVRVLLAGAGVEDAANVRSALAGPEAGLFEVTHVSTLDAAMGCLEREGADIILLDLGLETGDRSGLGTIERFHGAAPGTPVVVLTQGGAEQATDARVFQAGAQDYVVKGRLNEHPLQRVLLHAIERQRLLAESESNRQQQQQLREELVLHELRLKDEFMSHVSHELRSPLTAVRQFAGILIDELAGPVTAEQRDALRVIVRNVHQLEAMIEDLLEATRMQTGKLSIELQSVLPSEVVADAIDTLRVPAQEKDVRLITQVDDDLPTAYADPVRTRQILINLIGNAVKFVRSGGSITVRVVLDNDPSYLRFEVEDTGPGLSPEHTERIFERLYQVKGAAQAGRRGLGLGLFICKELVNRQGGRIWVTSELGRGSSFRFTLPVFGPHTPLTTRDHMIKRDLLARVQGPDGPITTGVQRRE
ncbi:MAG: response regulator [Vicinamibacteria bacterium]|nr:response regulator [Vicinamibacteria bacterium]